VAAGPPQSNEPQMTTYIVRRLLWVIVLLFLVSAITFVIFFARNTLKEKDKTKTLTNKKRTYLIKIKTESPS